jgi:hypothetical protein
MHCKDIEIKILGSNERKLSQNEITAIEQHLAQCAGCAQFKNDLMKLRNGLNHMPQPAPSTDVVERTIALCHQELATKEKAATGRAFKWRRFPVPKLLWIAIPVVMALTTYLMLPGLSDLASQASSYQSMAVLAIILQNAAMLVLAPILIKTLRRRKISWNHYDAQAS